VALLAACAFALLTAPTAGDVGGCGSTPTALDPGVYARARKNVDCQRCTECGLSTDRCTRACDANAPSEIAIPSTCHPLLHDGEVCIRALRAASCSDYAGFVDDAAPSAPTECEFCKLFDDGGSE
jgi:hypothetical protein